MWVPTVHGLIDRRILVNYRVDPEVMQQHLPPPFRVKAVRGFGLAGICLIRMKHVRPWFLPFPVLGCTENGALRFAVEWEQNGERHSGVYIPKRFSTSRSVVFAGGRFFPGVHALAKFEVEETETHYSIQMNSELNLSVRGTVTQELTTSRVFENLEVASAFYEGGAIGFSDTRTPGRYEGLELQIPEWKVQPLAVEHVACDFFDDPAKFPPGSIAFDNALLMRTVKNVFVGRGSFCCPVEATAPATAVSALA